MKHIFIAIIVYFLCQNASQLKYHVVWIHKIRHIILHASFLHKVSQTTEKRGLSFKKGLKVGSDPWNETNLLSLGLAAKCFVNNEKERRK